MAKVKKAENAQTEETQELPVAGQKFTVGGKAFKYVVAKFHVSGLGDRTALEASSDDTQYEELGGKTINEYLVEIGAAVISEA